MEEMDRARNREEREGSPHQGQGIKEKEATMRPCPGPDDCQSLSQHLEGGVIILTL